MNPILIGILIAVLMLVIVGGGDDDNREARRRTTELLAHQAVWQLPNPELSMLQVARIIAVEDVETVELTSTDGRPELKINPDFAMQATTEQLATAIRSELLFMRTRNLYADLNA